MPAAMTLILEPGEDQAPIPRAGSWLPGFLDELLARAGIARALPLERPRRFSLSQPMPVEGHLPPSGPAGIAGEPGAKRPRLPSRFRIRLAWLVDSDLDRLWSWAEGLSGDQPVCVDTSRGRLLVRGAVLSEPGPTGWNRRIPYERLHEEASDTARTMILKFCSPTCLRRDGQAYPLPDPSGIFLGYLRAWETFSGIPLAGGVREAIATKLILTDFRLRRCAAHDEDGSSIPAFMGSATFRLHDRHPESVLKGINALADYASFCGTGIGTEKGMGLTRRIVRQRGSGR